ncbi:MAG TPA: hypothetical protein VK576_11245, partial [Thermoleophilia bacterium]|nr:hypothetical protein [Thermoleophilia bacterium]
PPLALAACLIGLPLLVYLASYADYFASGHTVGQWLHLQGHMATFNLHVRGSSDMASAPASWIFDVSPIWYRWGLTQSGVRGLIGIGNPLLWWGAVAAFVTLLWAAWRRRDGRLAVAPLLVAVLYLPWLATSRQTYIYYLTPVVPFLAILVAAALARLADGTAPSTVRSIAWFVAGAAWMALAAGGTLALRLAATAAVLAFVVVAVALERRAERSGPTATTQPADPPGHDPVPAVDTPMDDLLVVDSPAQGPAPAVDAPAPPGRDRRSGALAASAAWLYTGAVTGLAIAWLPFLLTLPASYAYYERLTWLPTWR